MTAYRFTGDAPELFLDLSGVMVVAGVVRDPEAPGYVAPWDEGYQPPGELRPGQEFELPADVELHHARIERKDGRKWVQTVGEIPAADDIDNDGEA